MKAHVPAKLLRFFETLADAVRYGVEVAEVEEAGDVRSVEPIQEAPLQHLAAALIEPGQDGTQLLEGRDGIMVGCCEEAEADLLRLVLHALAARELIEPAVLGGLCQPSDDIGMDAFALSSEPVPQLHDRALEGLLGIFGAAALPCQPRANARPYMLVQLIQCLVFLALDVRTQLRDQHRVRVPTLKQPHPL